MKSYSVRLATEGDVEQIFGVHRDSVRKLCAGSYTDEQIDFWLEGRTPSMYLDAISRSALWVAEAAEIFGFVETSRNEVTKLFVRGDSAGTGVGRSLLHTATSDIARAGHVSAYLESTVNAKPFYELNGFVVTGTGYFSHGRSSLQLEIVMMEKPLLGESVA